MSFLDEAAKVRSKSDAAQFVGVMVRELRSNPEDWQNATLESFLDAMSGWIEDMDGYYENRDEPVPDSPSWKTVAEILAAATMYE